MTLASNCLASCGRMLAIVGIVVALAGTLGRAEDGYRLWLRYDRITDETVREAYAAQFHEIAVTERPVVGGTLDAACVELATGLGGLLGDHVPVVDRPTRDGVLLIGTTAAPSLHDILSAAEQAAMGEEGFVLRHATVEGKSRLVLVANREIGVLYGVFALLRQLQMHQPLEQLDRVETPRIQRRLLNHWDNLNRTVERGSAGQSIWEWFALPDYVNPRYRDYARAAASVGINGAVLNNVNANALILTPEYLAKVAAIASVLRPYGVRVYLTARFNAPVEISGLKTADPLDPSVRDWWREKADDIYRAVPDFGGFLVKANSEGQPGPQKYGRTHVEGANVIAEALAPHGGVLFWRAFVYDDGVPDDRAKQAFNEFKPLDGRFRPNVIVQVKNGPIDFMPREPFHPLFGAMPKTPLALEVQITQEYLGTSLHLAFLAPMWKETLDADTATAGPGSTVAKIITGQVDHRTLTAIAGVANIGTDRNWCGHPLAAANWYAFGRLAWDPAISAEMIADEWTRMTFSNVPAVTKTLVPMLLGSREAVVNYEMPLGLHHIMAEGHHYGPGPWVDGLARKDWTAVYYHRADAAGLGFDRTSSGSNALAQYAPAVAARWGNLATCPDELLLWFHHVPWNFRVHSGRTLWDELCIRYQHGVETIRGWRTNWSGLRGSIDEERFAHVAALLGRQEHDAREWRDACLLYFQTFSKRDLPAGVEPAEHALEYYKAHRAQNVPGDPSNK